MARLIELSRSALLPHPVSDVYDLVSDIRRYPAFVPGIRSVQVLSERIASDDLTTMDVLISMGRAGLGMAFTTANKLKRNHRIEMRLREPGPLEDLDGSWEFEDIGGQGCRIVMVMKFRVGNPLLRASLEPALSHLSNRVVSVFAGQAARDLSSGRVR